MQIVRLRPRDIRTKADLEAGGYQLTGAMRLEAQQGAPWDR